MTAIALTWAVSVLLAALALYVSRVPNVGHPQDDPQPTEPWPTAARTPSSSSTTAASPRCGSEP